MNAFVRVVEAGTFTKAADTLDVPNATITRLIRQLEQELRVSLLHRTTRSVTVTPEGAICYECVVRLLADLADIESSATQSLAKPSGKVRVETAAAIAAGVIVPALSEFCQGYPEVEVEIEIGVSSKHTDLVSDGIDCAIRAGEVSERMMVTRGIGEFHFVTCATPDFLQHRGTPRTPADLSTRPSIGMIYARSGRAQPFQFSDGSPEAKHALSHRLVVSGTNSYLAAGLAGLGIIQAPSYAVHEAISAGRLVALLKDWRTPTIPVHVIYAPNRFLSAKVRVFID